MAPNYTINGGTPDAYVSFGQIYFGPTTLISVGPSHFLYNVNFHSVVTVSSNDCSLTLN